MFAFIYMLGNSWNSSPVSFLCVVAIAASWIGKRTAMNLVVLFIFLVLLLVSFLLFIIDLADRIFVLQTISHRDVQHVVSSQRCHALYHYHQY